MTPKYIAKIAMVLVMPAFN